MNKGQKLFQEFYMRTVIKTVEDESEVLVKDGPDREVKGRQDQTNTEGLIDKYDDLVREKEKESLKREMYKLSKIS